MDQLGERELQADLAQLGCPIVAEALEQRLDVEIATLRHANPEPRPGRIAWPSELDTLLDELAVFGPADRVEEGLRAWDHLVDVVSVLVPPSLGRHPFDVIEAAAPRTAVLG